MKTDPLFLEGCEAVYMSAFGRSSDSRIVLLPRLPARAASSDWWGFVPGYSGGSAADFHGFPLTEVGAIMFPRVHLVNRAAKSPAERLLW